MSRDWCVVVRPRESAGDDEIPIIDLALEMREPAFDFDRSDGEFLVYVDATHSVKRTEKTILRTLATSGVVDAVVTPLPVGRWNDEQHSYVFDGAEGEPEEAVPPGETRWVVRAAPASAFAWRQLRSELDRRGRRRLHETDHTVEIGARDEADAPRPGGRPSRAGLRSLGRASSTQLVPAVVGAARSSVTTRVSAIPRSRSSRRGREAARRRKAFWLTAASSETS